MPDLPGRLLGGRCSRANPDLRGGKRGDVWGDGLDGGYASFGAVEDVGPGLEFGVDGMQSQRCVHACIAQRMVERPAAVHLKKFGGVRPAGERGGREVSVGEWPAVGEQVVRRCLGPSACVVIVVGHQDADAFGSVAADQVDLSGGECCSARRQRGERGVSLAGRGIDGEYVESAE